MKTKEEKKELIMAIVAECVVKGASERVRVSEWVNHKQKSDHLQCYVYESNMINNAPAPLAVWKRRTKQFE